MLKFICTFMLYCFICGILTVFVMWKEFHKEENREEFEYDLEKFSKEMIKGGRNITRDDMLVILYLAGVFFGFAIVPISIFNKFIGKKNVR